MRTEVLWACSCGMGVHDMSVSNLGLYGGDIGIMENKLETTI